MTVYDITIIGGGPTGLFTAFYAHLRQASVKIIDSLHQLGGQPATLYPEKKILDIPAYDNITGQQLTTQLLKQLNRFDTTICLNELVTAITKVDDIFHIQTNQHVHYSKTVIIAIGGGSFKPRTLALDGINNYNNIHYYVQNMEQYINQDVMVLGGGDSAVDWALAFDNIAKTTIVHRRPQFRALEHSVSQLHRSTVTIMTPFIPIALNGVNDVLHSVTLENVKTKETVDIKVDHLFINYGFSTSMLSLEQWGVDTLSHRITVNSQQQTSIPGIFAVGDCCTYDGKVELIATGFGEAPTAVNNAIRYINPKARLQPMHSTSL